MSTFSLNNLFVYYVTQIDPGHGFKNDLDVISTNEIGLDFAGEVTYQPPIILSSLVSRFEVLAEADYTNATDGTDLVRFDKKETKNATFTTSFTEGVTVGAETTVKTGIPFVVEGEVKLSAEAMFSSTQTRESSTTQEFEMDTTLSIPPWTHVVATMEIDSYAYHGQVTAKLLVTGRLFINYGEVHKRVTMPDLIRAVRAKPPGKWQGHDDAGHTFELTDEEVKRFSFNDEGVVVFSATGDISGDFGAKLRVVKMQTPIKHAAEG